MRLIKLGLLLLMALAVAGCGGKFYTYRGPEVTQVVVNKGARRMYLLHNSEVLEAYDIDLGFAPTGDKKVRGDGKTPEGNYLIDRRNPESQFYLSIGISYPNAHDRAEARALGASPGGDIFIHGQPNIGNPDRKDWTAGCVAVTNKEMRDIYAMVRNGTPVQINP